MLTQCWATVYDAGRTLSQHWFDALVVAPVGIQGLQGGTLGESCVYPVSASILFHPILSRVTPQLVSQLTSCFRSRLSVLYCDICHVAALKTAAVIITLEPLNPTIVVFIRFISSLNHGVIENESRFANRRLGAKWSYLTLVRVADRILLLRGDEMLSL